MNECLCLNLIPLSGLEWPLQQALLLVQCNPLSSALVHLHHAVVVVGELHEGLILCGSQQIIDAGQPARVALLLSGLACLKDGLCQAGMRGGKGGRER
jgi:hypothetical protein